MRTFVENMIFFFLPSLKRRNNEILESREQERAFRTMQRKQKQAKELSERPKNQIRTQPPPRNLPPIPNPSGVVKKQTVYNYDIPSWWPQD